MRRKTAIGVLVLPPVLSTALLACGPALRQGDDFTPARVRALLFDDACRLQRYFDQRTSNYEQRSDFNVGAEGHRTAGTAIYRLKPGQQTEVFADLVARFYKRVPILPRDVPLQITVDYQESKGHRTLPIGATTIVALPPDNIELPYHPCLGAYFFGAPHYAARRQIAEQERWERGQKPPN